MLLSPTGSALANEPQWASRVLKISVERNDGSQEVGSAISLAGDRLVTNCHVLRNALQITVFMSGERRLAQVDLRDTYRDVCFLTLPGLGAEPIPMIEMGETRIGLKVVAVGYTNGEYGASHGKVLGLYTCECDGGKVIQTSAQFDKGASGGGLFDQNGRLVGLLTFKAIEGGNFHFALPVGWLRHLANNPTLHVSDGGSFWETPGKESGFFLAACELGAKQNWIALKKLAQEWCEHEPYNPEAWMAMGRAKLGLSQTPEAVLAFQQALMLDSAHAEAEKSLRQLEFELGYNLVDATGI